MQKIQKGYNYTSKIFRLPDEQIEKLDKLAYENNPSLNQLVIRCLNFALDNLDTENEQEEPSPEE